MDTNPDTLKFSLNQQIHWFDDNDQTVKTGVVVNIGFDHLDVIFDKNKYAKVLITDVLSPNT